MRQVLLYTDEDGVWCAEVPSLPGCYSNGATKEEALTHIQEAIALYIETLIEHQQPIPVEKFDAMVVAVATQ